MLLIDTRTTELMPTSLFLTRAEFRKLYPHRLNSRMSYVFKHDQPLEVPDDEAKLLLEKYPHVLVFGEKPKDKKEEKTFASNRHQELSKLKYRDIQKLGRELGMVNKDVMIKTDLLIDAVVAKEIEVDAETKKAAALKRDGE